MNILFIFPQDVIPATDGGKISIFEPLKAFATTHNVYAIFPTKDGTSLSELINKYADINVIANPFYLDTSDTIYKVLSNVFYKEPFKFKKYFSKKALNIIDELFIEVNFDAVVLNHAHMGNYGQYIQNRHPHCKVVLREHNIEYQLVKEYFHTSKAYFLKPIIYWQYLKTKKIEEEYWKTFSRTLLISDSDFHYIRKNSNEKFDRLSVVYDGVHKSLPNMSKCKNANKKYFLFSGSLETLQNRAALSWFYNNVWLKSKINKHYSLFISGSTENEVLKLLNVSGDQLVVLNIQVVGFVDNYDCLLTSSTALISPTTIGSGVRVKVLEALSKNIPCLVSYKDLNMMTMLSDKKNILSFADHKEFEEKIEWLESHSNKLNLIKGMEEIVSSLTWNSYKEKIELELQKN